MQIEVKYFKHIETKKKSLWKSVNFDFGYPVCLCKSLFGKLLKVIIKIISQ